MQAQGTTTVDSVAKALTHKYIKTEGGSPTVDTSGVISILKDIPAEAMAGSTSLISAINDQHPGTILPPAARAVVASIDDCTKMIFSLADLEVEVEQQLRLALPMLAAQLVARPDTPLQKGPTILHVLDQLVGGMIGWAANLGKSGTKLYDKAQETIDALRSDDTKVPDLAAELSTFFEKEQSRVAKLEDRLAASETGLLRSQQAKNKTANMLNHAMSGKKLTADIVSFLQGPWYDSVQLFVITKGIDSEEWFRAEKLTETIIWTYQPINSEDSEANQHDKQKLYRIIEHLPGEIRQLLVALEHNTDAAESALESIEYEHVQIVSGMELEYVDFEPIECEEEMSSRSKVSRLLLRKVNAFQTGQWFTYNSDDVHVRIKLVLKLDDVKQMLFTNRNGMKVMQRGFDEIAYYLSSSVIKPLNADEVFSTTFRTYYEGLVEEHARQMKRLAERRAEADREEQSRERASQKALADAAELARANEEAERKRVEEERRDRLEMAKTEAAKAENAEKVTEITSRVQDLAIGAWLKLPGPDGRLEECKLAVRISASDKMIFVSRAGTKIGEYTSVQLVQLMVAGQGEIRDEGVEFEDTLAQVVSRLRQDRTKSYDDLTGS